MLLRLLKSIITLSSLKTELHDVSGNIIFREKRKNCNTKRPTETIPDITGLQIFHWTIKYYNSTKDSAWQITRISLKKLKFAFICTKVISDVNFDVKYLYLSRYAGVPVLSNTKLSTKLNCFSSVGIITSYRLNTITSHL